MSLAKIIWDKTANAFRVESSRRLVKPVPWGVPVIFYGRLPETSGSYEYSADELVLSSQGRDSVWPKKPRGANAFSRGEIITTGKPMESYTYRFAVQFYRISQKFR